MEHQTIKDEDLSQIAQWNVELHEDEGSTPMSLVAAEERLRGWLKHGKFTGIAFIDGGKRIGYTLFEQRAGSPELRGSTDSLYLRQFYILREHRRQGLGSQAFRHFIQEYALNDARVILDVKASNPAAQRFWESLGFLSQHIEYQLN